MSVLQEIYQNLFDHFGPQHWWPGDSPFEICLGAILTQNTNWQNVEKAMANLKQAQVLNYQSLLQAKDKDIARWIQPSGYFNVKTKRLRAFLTAIDERYQDFSNLQLLDGLSLREFLLSITGIGPETADSMVLYAFGHATFVIDAYTKRFLVRHRLMDAEADYYRMKDYFESHLESDASLYNEYHALIVMLGKHYCKKSKPDCEACPLKEINGGPVF